MNIYTVKLSARSMPRPSGQWFRHNYTVWVVGENEIEAIQAAKALHIEPSVISITKQNGDATVIILPTSSGEGA